ncbi:MAG TPA: hypothetical protein VEO91_13465 [Candidatus Limnocylindria bacterium]|nr:hypothetical protein [Candidatus Limnocylindria bacterium]
MTTDTGRPPAPATAAEEGLLIGDGSDVGELDRRADPRTDRPSEPSGLPLGLCPFLATSSGAWRAAFPSHEHLCAAVEPPVPLALDKQRRLCLVAYHETCATYRAALAERAPMGVGAGGSSVTSGRGSPRPGSRPWTGRPVARTTPVLLERPRPGMALSAAAGRSLGQLVLVALVVIAFVLIALARLGTPGSPAAVPVSPSAATSAAPSNAATTPTATDQPSHEPSETPQDGSSPGSSPGTSGLAP